jgi:hypothetical protein
MCEPVYLLPTFAYDMSLNRFSYLQILLMLSVNLLNYWQVSLDWFSYWQLLPIILLLLNRVRAMFARTSFFCVCSVNSQV